MGKDVDRVNFTKDDFRQFHNRLEQQLSHLKTILKNPLFGNTPPAIGAELELYIVDSKGNPLSKNEELLSLADNPRLTPELNAYNIEYNAPPCLIADNPFGTLEKNIIDELTHLQALSSNFSGQLAAIGILPTLEPSNFGIHCLTQRKRYHALVNQLCAKRGSNFKIDINGENPLKIDLADITLEGANTSFQIHHQVQPKDFADTYNAAQLVTPLVMAVSANSPTLFGHHLWDETRIPLFKQSIDTRHYDRYQWNEPARVNFGHGWLRKGAYELFSESVQLYSPILPICTPAQHHENNNPPLDELVLHQSTVWLWNRPVYDSSHHGHLRIEMRCLPSGPTPVDMIANAAFFIGLAEGYKGEINELLPSIPFQTAEYNFYRSAQFSLDANIIWPQTTTGYKCKPIMEILEENIPIAEKGLRSIGIEDKEIKHYLEIIQKRIAKKQNGAIWQKKALKQLNQTMNKTEALHKMLFNFIDYSKENIPVSEWT